MQAWRANLRAQFEFEFNFMDDEQDFLDRGFLSSPMSLHGMRAQERCEGGHSVPGKKPNKDQKRKREHEVIWEDYFAEDCTYDNKDFCRKF